MDKIKTIYCDFDGTISKQDAVNTFFEYYASPKWKEYEDLWVAGKITSRENAIQQVALIRHVSKKELNEFIDNIEIDDFFADFVNFLKQNDIKLVILSDGFDLFITKTLEHLNIKDVEVYANHLIYNNGTFSIEFPHHNKQCSIGAGMCKCAKVKEKDFCYIGDGTSDLCIAKKAKYLFATKKLKQHCEKESLSYYEFNSFYDILNVFKRCLNI